MERLAWEGFAPYLLAAVFMAAWAGIEWIAYLAHTPPHPWLYTGYAFIASSLAAAKWWRMRDRLERLKLGRDGERYVGQYLERLRADSTEVLHDIPGENFNIDHVVLSAHGIFAIETKTWSKPLRGKPRIQLTDSSVLVNGLKPERDPIVQAQAEARWLSRMLEENTRKRFPVRGVVLIPGWFIDRMSTTWRNSPDMPWVLAPTALPRFMEREPVQLSEADLQLAVTCLSQYIRAAAQS